MLTFRSTLVLSSVLIFFVLSGCKSASGSLPKLSDESENKIRQDLQTDNGIDGQQSRNRHQEYYGPKRIDTVEINTYLQDRQCKVYEDAEDGTIDGWNIFDNNPSGALVRNISEDAGHVIAFSGNGIKNGYSLRRSNGELWNNTDANVLEWSGKFDQDFIVFVSVLLDNATVKYLSYSPKVHPQINDIFPFSLPPEAMDGKWHRYTRDLQSDIAYYLSGRTVVSVLDFQVRGNGYLDNIKLMRKEGCNSQKTVESNDYADETSSTLDFHYKVSLDIDYVFKVQGGENVNNGTFDRSLAEQIKEILNFLHMGDNSSQREDSSSSNATELLHSAEEVLKLANELLYISENSAVEVNRDYIQAMLRLSDDIGKMADRIGEMADRILETEDKIVVLALRILEIVAKTQDILLETQKNFNHMLEASTNAITDISEQVNVILALLPELQSAIENGDSEQVAGLLENIKNILNNFKQLPKDNVNDEIITQITAMIQELMTQTFQNGFSTMNNNLNRLAEMMQEMLTAMLDSNSGMNPNQIVKDVTGSIEYMVQMSEELLEKSMETGHSQEALEALQEFSQLLENMADRALVAMDKMVTIGVMAHDTATKMINLMAKTQENLLTAQQNFNGLMLELAGRKSED